MDKKRSLINVLVAVGGRLLLLVVALLTRRLLIQYTGTAINGLESLYASIIGVLSVADLGVGSAINFCMYKPIVDGDNQRVAALYNLYRRFYLIVGVVVVAVGAAIMPLLPYLAKDFNGSVNLYLTFALSLAAVVIGFAFNSKISLINAYKNNYVNSLIATVGTLIRRGLQILVLVLWHSYELYLVAVIASVCFSWLATEIYAHRHYRHIIHTREKVDLATRRTVVKNAKAMCMHKIGGTLVNTLDSVIISAFLSVTVLGYYNNYVLIMSSLTGVLTLFLSPLTATIGHLCAEKNLPEEKKYFHFMYYFNFALALVFFLGYYAVIDDVVRICFGPGLAVGREVALVITINCFVQFLRNAVNLFRDVTGTFYYDRWRPLAEGLTNLVLSIIFVLWFGVVGVIAATIITNLLICHVVEPLVLYRHAFGARPTKYYAQNYALMLVFGGALAATHFAHVQLENMWLSFLANGFIAVGIAGAVLVAMLVVYPPFRHNVGLGWRFITRPFRRRSTPVTPAPVPAPSPVAVATTVTMVTATGDQITTVTPVFPEHPPEPDRPKKKKKTPPRPETIAKRAQTPRAGRKKSAVVRAAARRKKKN